MLKDKLCLGTVQFGLEYGVNNKLGKPDKKQAFAMLDLAVEQGIKYFDTAAAYGNAEEVLGDYIAQRCLQNKLKIISKLRPNLIADDCKKAEEVVESEIRASLQRLHVDALEGYLLHTPTNFYNKSVINGLQRVKAEGLVKNIGVSIYESKHALDVVSSKEIDFIQIPYNPFDQRLDKTDFFNIAKDNGVTVFARSPFLQGLMFMQPEKVPPQLNKAAAYLHEFRMIIEQYSLSRTQACMALSGLHPGIDYVVFGVDSLAQLQEDIAVFDKESDYMDCIKELRQHFVSMEKEIIFPSLWARK